jgi:hypothetical protein
MLPGYIKSCELGTLSYGILRVLGELSNMKIVTLNETDFQTLMNALHVTYDAVLEEAKKHPSIAKALIESADAYQQLGERIEEADRIDIM